MLGDYIFLGNNGRFSYIHQVTSEAAWDPGQSAGSLHNGQEIVSDFANNDELGKIILPLQLPHMQITSIYEILWDLFSY